MIEEIIQLLEKQIAELQMLKGKYMAEQCRSDLAGNNFTIITLKERQTRANGKN